MGTVNHLHRLGPMEVAKLTLLHVVTSEVQRLICTASLRMRSTACAQLHIEEGPDGLLAKWLRVRVRIRAGARKCTSCTFPPIWFISVVNTSVFTGSIYSLSKWFTYEYSIDDVTTWSWVNLVTP